MIAITPIAEKLEEQELLKRRVKGALEFAGLKNAPSRLPAFFVVPEGESAGIKERMGLLSQKVVFNFMIVAVLNAAARDEQKLSEDLKNHVDAIKDALLNWTPPGAKGAIHYRGSRLLNTDGATLVWAAQFQTYYQERRT